MKKLTIFLCVLAVLAMSGAALAMLDPVTDHGSQAISLNASLHPAPSALIDNVSALATFELRSIVSDGATLASISRLLESDFAPTTYRRPASDERNPYMLKSDQVNYLRRAVHDRPGWRA